MRGLARFLFAAMMLGAVAGGAWAYFYLKSAKPPATGALKFFPAGAVVYAETDDIFDLQSQIIERSLAVDGLRTIHGVGKFCAGLKKIDSLAKLNEELWKQLDKNKVHFALYGNGESWMFGFALKTLGDEERLRESIAALFPGVQTPGGEFIRLPMGAAVLFASVTEGVVTVSNSKSLAADGAGNNILNSGAYRGFREMYPGRELFAFFLNDSLYPQKNKAWPQLPFRNGGITSGIIQAGTSEIRINGFFTGKGSGQQLKNHPRPTSLVTDGLPGETTWFHAIALDSFPGHTAPAGADETGFWQTAEDSALYNVRRAFFSNCADYLCEFRNNTGGAAVMTNVRDTVALREHLEAMSDSLLGRGAAVYRLHRKIKLFGGLSDRQCRYAMALEKRLYCFEQLEDLDAVVFLLRNQGPAGPAGGFPEYCKQQLPQQFNIIRYTAPRRLPGIASGAAGGTPSDFLRFSHFSFSAVSEGKVRARLHLQYSPDESMRPAANMLWSAVMDTTISRQPELFRNHNTGEPEIIVQDDATNLHLLSAKGEVLWSKLLGEPLMSKIFIVDAFRNGKVQMLFNTKSSIHLIDRNGQYVEGFPLRLPHAATAPMSVFDYERSRDYRLVVPCADKRIRNFTVGGVRIKDFAAPQTEEIILLAPQYVNVAGSEYLVVVDSAGRIYSLNRRGQPKGNLTNRMTAGCKGFYIDAGANPAHTNIIYVDEREGLMNKISLADKKQIVPLTPEIRGGSYEFTRADNNRFTDVLVTGQKQLVAYDLAGNRLFVRQTEIDADRAGAFAGTRGTILFAHSSSQGQLVIFRGQQAEKTAGYRATSPPLTADLFRNGEQYLVFADGRMLHCLAIR